MAFTLSTFVKHTGGEALREHLRFRVLELANNVPRKVDAAELARFFKISWPNLSPDDIQRRHQDFDRAEPFANDDAQAVLRASCLRSKAALDELERWTNDRARALALAILRTDPHLFEDAESQLGVHRLLASRQLWSGFQLTSDAPPSWSEDRRTVFADSVRDVYRARAGVRRSVKLEVDRRQRVGPDGTRSPPIHQVTIFHEGDANREAVFRESGEVAIEGRRPALMAALVFNPITGTVEVASKGGRQVQQSIAEAFAGAFWAKTPEITRLKPANFALQKLKAPTQFAFKPSDGLRSVCLTGIVLKACGAGRLDVTLRHPDPSLQMTPWQIADGQFGAGNPLRDPAMFIVSADIRFEFEPGPGEQKPKARTVKLSLGNGSNKAKLSERHQRIVDEHLRQWNLSDAGAKPEPATRTLELTG